MTAGETLSQITSTVESKFIQNGPGKTVQTCMEKVPLEQVDVFCPKPSPRLKKHKKTITESSHLKINNSHEQDESFNNNKNNCMNKFYQKDCRIENLQNNGNVNLEELKLNECSIEKDNIQHLVKSQVLELKQIKGDLLKLAEEGNKADTSIKETESKVVDKLRKDLRKKSCLLKDAQLYISKLERKKAIKPEVNLLRDKIESLEDEKRYLTKVKRELEDDLAEVKLEKENIAKRELLMEKRYKEKAEENLTLNQQLSENEESIEEIMFKYKSVITSISKYQQTIEDQSEELSKLCTRNKKLEEDFENCISGNSNSSSNWRKSLELEKVTRIRVINYD